MYNRTEIRYNINISGDYPIEKLKEYAEILQDDIEDLIEESNFNENLYIQKSMEIKKKATILEAKRIKKILEILNEEQRDEFADHFKEWIIE